LVVLLDLVVEGTILFLRLVALSLDLFKSFLPLWQFLAEVIQIIYYFRGIFF
jgi:hypothetical protein